MGLPLLRDAFDMMASVPMLSPFTLANDDENFRAGITRTVAAARKAAVERKLRSDHLQEALERVSLHYIDSGADPGDVVRDLEEFKVRVQAEIEAGLARRGVFARDTALLGNSFVQSVPEDGRFFNENARAMIAIFDGDIAVSRDLVDFLVVLLADIDPSSRGGPFFDNADALIANLHADDA